MFGLKHFRLLCGERGRRSLALARQHSAPHTPSLGPVPQPPQGLPIPGTPEAMLHTLPLEPLNQLLSVDASTLEVFKSRLDVALSSLVWRNVLLPEGERLEVDDP